VGGNGWVGAVQSSVRYPPDRRVRAVRGDLNREAPDAVPAVAAVRGLEVDWRSHTTVAADVDVFRADAARARVEEPKVSIHTLVA
jgi:hypothetical protein